MEERKTYFVDVIVPIAIPRILSYRVPLGLEEGLGVGMRVIVPLGRSKLYTAIVKRVHHEAPLNYTAKYLEAILDNEALVTSKQLKFWEWMSSYYCCTEGEVMSAAMPSSLKLASESKITLRDGSDVRNSDELTDKELLIVEALEIHGELDIKDLTEILQQKTVMQHVKALVDKGWVISFEELKQKFKPKTEKIIGLSKEFQQDAALERAVGELERGRGHKQLDALMGFLREAKNYSVWISRKQLMESANVQSATIKALVDKGLFEIQEVEIDPFKSNGDTDAKEVTLSEDQERAKLEIQASFEEKSVCLLHGITGSGKTEVYIELIKEELGKGNQALFLIPEIALTTQLIGRLEKFFPEQIVVYHSKFNLRERTDVWKEILKGKPMLIVGARSSVFLPFHNLSLILVDEEHESSYKQYDPAPRYNARDASVVLASIHRAKVLMGSATPSIETYHNAEQGKYGLVTMNQRFGGIMLPEIMCADLRKEIKRKSLQGHFSHLLREHMEETLRAGKQIILFQNRRGYAPLWQCHTCGWVPQCTRCDVSLTYHKRAHHLNCHYCGYTIDPPVVCKVCGSRELKNLGFGTEMIEEELQEHFPEVKVARMDLDTTRSKHAYQKMLAAFEAREIDVLVGTQMISKGLDFDHVALVGILNADQMMNFPDFRSFERSYQLMTQVAGRAGRRSERGKVIIQTYKPDHWVIQKVIQGDYLGLYKQELVERINHDYPPYFRLIKITLKHKEERVVEQAGQDFAKWLRVKFGERILGPEAPHIPRINNKYIRQIMVKLEKESSPAKLKAGTLKLMDEFLAQPAYKSVRIILDIDPA